MMEEKTLLCAQRRSVCECGTTVSKTFTLSLDTWVYLLSDELFLAFVKSTEACAEIISVDTTEALGMPGIHGLINYRDIKKNELQLYMLLAENKVQS